MKRRALKCAKPDWSRIHRESSLRIYTPVLALFSALYRGGITLRLCAYRHGLFKVRSLPGFVVSVGNLTTGGTGKTPAVITLGKWAVQKGYRTAILSRGFGGKHGGEVLEVSDGTQILYDSSTTGDEPYLMAKAVPGAAVIISKKRYRAGRYAHEKFGTQLFILDDGFQHIGLKRDLDLVLIDTSYPFGNCHLLPRGPLREPVSELTRADAIVLTRFNKRAPGVKTETFLRQHFPSIPLLCADHVPGQVVFPGTSQIQSSDGLRSMRVVAFAGIAQPKLFKETLENAGAHVVRFRKFSDHYSYTPGDIEALIRMKEETGASYILTTEKDWIRIAGIGCMPSDMAYLTVSFSFLSGYEEIFKMIGEGVETGRKDI